MTNDTNITNDKDINANIAHDDHFNDSIVTVSYTHLDVYKRQMYIIDLR